MLDIPVDCIAKIIHSVLFVNTLCSVFCYGITETACPQLAFLSI